MLLWFPRSIFSLKVYWKLILIAISFSVLVLNLISQRPALYEKTPSVNYGLSEVSTHFSEGVLHQGLVESSTETLLESSRNTLSQSEKSAATPGEQSSSQSSKWLEFMVHNDSASGIRKLRKGIKINCHSLFDGNETEIKKVKGKLKPIANVSDKSIVKATYNCSLVHSYLNNGLHVTELEKSFPIAFIFVIHNSALQVMRLLRILYRPHNQYLIAPDLKSKPEFIEIFRNIASCTRNIHIKSKLTEVKWGHKSLMEAQMQAYEDLMRIREKQDEASQWKYVINLSGKELPIATNYEIVRHLVKHNGTSVVKAHKIKRNYEEHLKRLRNQKIPFSVPLYKSLTFMALSFKFIKFILTNDTAITLYEFFKTCEIPEEHFFASVYMIPNVPGGYNPDIEMDLRVVKVFWTGQQYSRPCSSLIVHDICIVEAGDLKRIVEASDYGNKALFHNKYFMEYDSVIMDCMEERIMDKNKEEFKTRL